MLPQVPSMVAPEYHDSSSVKLKSFQLIQDLSNLSIGITDTCIVAVNQLKCKVIRNRPLRWNTGIRSQLPEVMDRFCRCIFRRVVITRKANFSII